MGKPGVFFEIGCRAIEKGRTFYTEMFGWTSEPYVGPNSFKLSTGAGKGTDGDVTSLGHEPNNYVMIYIEVENLTASLEKAEALGGQTVIPPCDIPGGGQFAWFKDLDGNLLGLYKPAH